MRLKVVHIGKTNSKEIDLLCKHFLKRAGTFMSCEVETLPKIKGGSMSSSALKQKEGEAILKTIGSADYLLLLDEKGKQMTSRDFAAWMQAHYVNDHRMLVLVIGGAYGFSEEVYSRCDLMLSLSAMTFNHELALLVLLEQVYRAGTIMNGHPYHND